MRRLNLAPRRVNRGEELGLVAIIVALMLAATMGMAALVIDVGLVRQERRELQNSADAAALAAAIQCAKIRDCASGSSKPSNYAGADSYANANAADGTATISGISLFSSSGGANDRVRVDVRTTGNISMRFAPAVGGRSTSVVTARATAGWGAPAGGTTIPLTFSYCEWKAMTGNGTTFPTGQQTIFFHNPNGPANQNVAARCAGPAGQDQPGGFGWLDTAGVCQATITAGGLLSADPGNSPPNPTNSGCVPANFLNTKLEIPVFRQSTGNGNNAKYEIYGLATFVITRMRLGGNGSIWTTSPAPAGCTPSQRCIQGYFDIDLKPWTGAIGGTSPDLGTLAVKMTA